MKKLMLLAAILLGTTAMVNAQTEPAKTAPVKEVKQTKKVVKKEKKAAVVATPTAAAKAESAKAKK